MKQIKITARKELSSDKCEHEDIYYAKEAISNLRRKLFGFSTFLCF